MIVPGHGRLGDMSDVGYYRDALTIIRDRVQDLIKKGRTLDQVKAAKPSLDYDVRYGASDAFIEAMNAMELLAQRAAADSERYAECGRGSYQFSKSRFF